MRENKFRGKHIHAILHDEDIPEGRWVYGYLCDENYINSPELMGELLIDPQTVGQYVGITDVNEKEIYEGDIINDIDYGIMQCIYHEGSFIWYKEDGFYIKCMNYVPVIEVIGNIYDNPELLDIN